MEAMKKSVFATAKQMRNPVLATRQQNTKTVVGNVAFDNRTMAQAVDDIATMIASGKVGQYVCTGNLDHLLMLQKDELFRSIYADADLVVADGMPIVWLSHLNGEVPLQERVAGSDLFWHLARLSHETGVRIFFLGGLPGAADKATQVVLERYPNAQICGSYCPPFETFGTPEAERQIEDAVRAAKPDILLVGFGAPKQEKWISRHCYRLQVPVSIGVGGTFEMVGGMVKRAPKWIQKSGMEWCFRLLQDPRRLWQRYLVGDLPFFVKLLCQSLLLAGKTRGQMTTIVSDHVVNDTQPEPMAESLTTLPLSPLERKEKVVVGGRMER